MTLRHLKLLVFTTTFILSSCGGGSGGGSSETSPSNTAASSTSTSGVGSASGGSSSTGSSSSSSGSDSSSSSASGSDSSSGDSSSSSAGSEETTLNLTVSYEDIEAVCQPTCRLDYSNRTYKPARHIEVQIVDPSSGVILDESPLHTDDGGKLSLSLPSGQSIKIRMIAASKVDDGSNAWEIAVSDNNGSLTQRNYDLYSVLSEEVELQERSIDLEFQLPSGWTGESYEEPRLSAPFAILDSMIASIEYFSLGDSGIQLPALRIFWSPENRPDQSSIGTSFYSEGDLWILGDENVDTDEFDDHILVHEWSHFLLDALSRDDSMGGDHGFNDLLDARVAYSEGLATALACLILGDEIYRDTSGARQTGGFGFSCEESDDLTPSGWFSESSTIHLIYDLFDEAEDQDDKDNIYLSKSQLREVLFREIVNQNTGSAATIFSFLAASQEVATDLTEQLLSLAQAKKIGNGSESLDVFGTAESNSAQGFKNAEGNETQNALPLYSQLILDGDALQLCQDTVHGRPNKLSNRRLVVIKVQDTGTYKISVTAVSEGESGPDQDPDFVIYSGSSIVYAAESSEMNSETAQVDLEAGSYWLEIYDFLLLDSDRIETVCQNITLESV